MYYYTWLSEPELKTTGIIKKLIKELDYAVQLDQKELSNFLVEWKLLSPKEVNLLYYGKVYRIKNISPDHLIIQTRRGRGNAYHYIDCQYNSSSCKIEMKIKTPNSVAYAYSLLPFILFILLTLLCNPMDLVFSFADFFTALCYSVIGILIGVLFLNFSVSAVKTDLKREMYKLKGLSPLLALS